MVHLRILFIFESNILSEDLLSLEAEVLMTNEELDIANWEDEKCFGRKQW